MKRYMYIFVSILLFSLGLNSIKAECSNSEIVKYQEQAKNINVTYDYREENEIAIFSIKFSNISPGISIYDRHNSKQYDYVSNELVLDGYASGQSYKFDYIVPVCGFEEVVFFTYQNMPYYNAYYKSDLCKGIEDFKYCQKWTKEPTSYETFEKAINKYREKLNNQNKEETTEEVDGLFEMIYKSMIKYYYITIPIALVVIVLIIVLVKLHNRKNDLF